jgi:hypothetical protein
MRIVRTRKADEQVVCAAAIVLIISERVLRFPGGARSGRL